MPDDGSDEPKHVAYRRMILKCCVSIMRLYVSKVQHNGMHQNTTATADVTVLHSNTTPHTTIYK
jgi:hypothetical protein